MKKEKIAFRSELILKRREKQALSQAKRLSVQLCERFGAKEVLLFGSLAKGRFDYASDIDLAVKGMQADYLKGYAFCLGETDFPLDLKVYEEMPAWLRKKVDKEGRTLYAGKKAS